MASPGAGDAVETGGRVSVIIPNYNHAAYVGDAIRSVIAQSYPHFEIIVVDDGSTDHSRDEISKFSESVRTIWQENRGLSAARNTGIRHASGEFVAVLDADDMYEPDFMRTMVHLLNNDPLAGAAYCGYRFVDQEKRPLPQIERRLVPPEEFHAALLDGDFLVPESILVRRTVYAAVGEFDVSLRACEDWDMWLRIGKESRVVGTSAILTRHRTLPGSMSSDPQRMIANRLAVLEKHLGREPASHLDGTPTARRAYGRGYLTSTVEFLQRHDPEAAYQCLAKLARIAPELLRELDTFYQLALGDQPKGSLGDFATLDLPHSERVLLSSLERLDSEDHLLGSQAGLREAAFAGAYHALALLSYGVGDLGSARRYLRHVGEHSPGRALQPDIVTLWAKSSVGPRLLNSLRALRRRLPGRESVAGI